MRHYHPKFHKPSRIRRSSQQRSQSDRRHPIRTGTHRHPGSARWLGYHSGAKQALRSYRQASILAVSVTAIFFFILGISNEAQPAPKTAPAQAAKPNVNPAEVQKTPPAKTEPAKVHPPDTQKSLKEATSTIQGLMNDTLSVLPKIRVALLLLFLAWGLSVLVRLVLGKLLSGWERTEAVSAIVRILLFLLAIGTGLSVLSGDATALVGSVGLVGLALSWALQTPIESFTGWVLNALRGYYRIGDRIEVGEVFGDVYRIGVLATTVWEAGGPGKSVSGSQPTGALITFPNWEILRSNITNYSRDFPYVWDEVTFAVANESDLRYAIKVIRKTADSVAGHMMREPAAHYQQLLRRQHLSYDVHERPQVYLTLADSWTNCTVRYLVPLRERRTWSSELILAISTELSRPEHEGRIIAAYPQTKVDLRAHRNRNPHQPASEPADD